MSLLDTHDHRAGVRPRRCPKPGTRSVPGAVPGTGPDRLVPLDGTGSARLQQCLLRFGIGFVFLYAAVSTVLDPEAFVGYFPSVVPVALVTGKVLPAFALFETGLAACLFAGRHTYRAALLATLTLLAIVVFNPGAFEVLFRNVAIACAAACLALQARTAGPSPVTAAATSAP